jgi:hypothetical protein
VALFRDRVEYGTSEALDLLVTLEEMEDLLLSAPIWTTLVLAVDDQVVILRSKLLR